jgi:hypothetical protein
MIGAPVFYKNSLVGILKSDSSIHPINHAAPYVSMAESTIIGKPMIRRLIEDMTDWKDMNKVIESIRMNPVVDPDIKQEKRRDGTIRYSFVVNVIKPYNLEYDPVTITAEIYPTWDYPINPKKPDERKEISWKSTKDSAPNIVIEYNYPKKNEEYHKTILCSKLKNELMENWKLKEEQREEIQIKGFHVDYKWRVDGKERDGKPMSKTHSNDKYISLEE